MLDLRSVVAKRELQSARFKRLKTAAALRRLHEDEVEKETTAKPRLPGSKGIFSRWRANRQRPSPVHQSTPQLTVHQHQSEQAVTDHSAQPVVLRLEDFPELEERSTVPLKKASEAKHRDSSPSSTRFTVLKPTLIFAVFALLFVLPASVSAMLSRAEGAQKTVTVSTQAAFEHLYQAGVYFQELQFTKAKEECDAALEGFTAAQGEIANFSPLLTALAASVPGPGKQFADGQTLIDAGEELARAGQQLSTGLAVLSAVDIQAIAQQEESELTNLLVVAHSALSPAQEHLNNAARLVQAVSHESVPQDKQQFVLLAQEALPEIAFTVRNGVQLTETLLAFLGHDEAKRYLVLFQNNHEMRPTGGFIGSLAIVDIENGVVNELDIPGGGVYDIAGQLTEKVISPKPLHLVNPAWNLQDANWFPHFPASAEKIQWFFEHSNAPEVDGVITVIPSVIEQLLAITGPIDLTEEFGVVITKENFYDEVQRRAEEKYDVTRESKKIIGAMTPPLFNQLFEKASDPNGLIEIVNVLREALAEKDILIYMNDPRMQEDFTSRDWSGELKNTDRDYLGIFHANIGGGKTDDVIEQIVKHRAEIGLDGSITNTVTLTRVHNGEVDDEFHSVKNLDYVRFYVPEGSELISADGFETPAKELFLPIEPGYENDEDLAALSGDIRADSTRQLFTNTEFGKTVFAGWVQTEVGERSTVTLRYRLPFTLDVNSFWNAIDHYSLFVQKQPGSFGDFFTSDLIVPAHLQSLRSYPSEYRGSVETALAEDLFVGMVIGQR